ncbi:MAG: SCO family protein [Deltaproteobacteria bacterium]|nr:SCO family protein [Deltaproteobacteria bacterium]
MRALALALLLGGCSRPLPSLGEVPSFALIDQAGRATGRNELVGKVWVANFIFTRCPTICPTFTAKMADLQRRAVAAETPLRLVSFSVDPEYDTPERLHAYGAGFDADSSTWSFLTGEMTAVREVVMDGFKMSMGRDNDDPSSIFHGTYFVLVDAETRIRGYYAVEEEAALARLLNDAARLAELAPSSPQLAKEMKP